MDGLRLALIIAGIVVVALVYFWTSRRRRMEREAGEFDGFGAWTDQDADPLVDRDAMTQPNSRMERSRAARAAPRRSDAPPEPAGGLDDPRVLEGLEAIAQSLDTRPEPRLGAMDAVDGPIEAPPAPAPRGRGAAQAPPPPPRPREPAAAPRPAPPRSAPRAATQDGGADASAEMVVVLNVMALKGAQFEGPALRDALDGAGLKPGDMQLYHYRAEAGPEDCAPIFSALNAVKPGTLDPSEMDDMHTPGVALVLRLPGLERPSEAFELMHGVAVQLAQTLGGQVCDESRSTLTRQALNHLRERIAESVRRRRLGG